MKIYTGGGDRGKTSLFSGERVPKHHERVAAYGEIDELNSVLGAVIAGLSEQKRLSEDLRRIQGDLFRVGAVLATLPSADGIAPPMLTLRDIEWLETSIDTMDEQLDPLKSFILPGGHLTAAFSHMARTVCRRAERRITLLAESEESPGNFGPLLVYLNRLSDYFFVLARYCNHLMGVPDVLWKQEDRGDV